MFWLKTCGCFRHRRCWRTVCAPWDVTGNRPWSQNQECRPTSTSHLMIRHYWQPSSSWLLFSSNVRRRSIRLVDTLYTKIIRKSIILLDIDACYFLVHYTMNIVYMFFKRCKRNFVLLSALYINISKLLSCADEIHISGIFCSICIMHFLHVIRNSIVWNY